MPRYRKQTRSRLIQIAAREFDRVGYPKASLSAVCRQAGLTTGALYHYFDSKSELAGAILDDHMERIETMSDEVRSTTRSSVERLVYFMAALSALLTEDYLVRAASRLAVDRTVAESSDLFVPWAEIATALVNDGDMAESTYSVDTERLGSFATSIVIGAWFVMDPIDPAARERLIGQMCAALLIGALRVEDREHARAAIERAFGC
ncbi:TetR/AcrR family transcriptional regulator [Agromyces silvae]|uniref:TetR/AcrR family transcriptional regulator n=1 Tax=Agromyces silvae TaxID=3388266 RepID=UPI00280B2029|nr:TetR/AcrR family transcriptional regulator [Agromyces protaetiae]